MSATLALQLLDKACALQYVQGATSRGRRAGQCSHAEGHVPACAQGGARAGACRAGRARRGGDEHDDARKRFGNAKSISSAQFNSEDDKPTDYEKEVGGETCWEAGLRWRHAVRNCSRGTTCPRKESYVHPRAWLVVVGSRHSSIGWRNVRYKVRGSLLFAVLLACRVPTSGGSGCNEERVLIMAAVKYYFAYNSPLYMMFIWAAKHLKGMPILAQARLSRFQGASAISSADFYGNGEGGSGGGGGGGGGPQRSRSDFDVSASDLVNKLSFQARRLPTLLSSPHCGHACRLLASIASYSSCILPVRWR